MVDEIEIDIVHDTGCLLRSGVFHPLMGSLTHNWFHQLCAYPLKERLRRFWHISMWRDVRLQLYQCKHSKAVIATSQRAATDLKQFNCKNPVVIHNGIRPLQPESSFAESTKRLRQALGAEDRILIVVTATNFYLKGVMTVLRALGMMDAKIRKAFLVVIAGHNQDMRFARYIDDHHLRDSCILAGWIDNIDDYYQAADIFLHPTYHDAGSLSTLKALAAGCAVVSSRFDGSADYIQNGKNGIVIERPDDAREVASIMEKLLDPELRSRLGRQAKQLISSITQERQFEQIESLYSQYLSARHGKP
jgi:UDP-glucose:(heptosyl)LPS alpha-1,3-glucosyltransferase